VNQKKLLLVVIFLHLTFFILGLLFVVKLKVWMVENILTLLSFPKLNFQFFLVLHFKVIWVIFGDDHVFFQHHLVVLLLLEELGCVLVRAYIGLEFHFEHAAFYALEA